MVCRLLFCTLVCVPNEAAQNHRQKEILQAQYKIMTYRLWYITWPSAILAFCVLDAIFTDLGKAWLQMPWMHVKLGLYLHCIYTTENANKFSINCKTTKLNTPILCAYGTKEPSFFCGSLLDS
jgi:uncharacterized membrane protein